MKFLEKEATEMYAIIDIETSGGKFDAESITEIAIIKYNGDKVLDKFSSLINPEKKIISIGQSDEEIKKVIKDFM